MQNYFVTLLACLMYRIKLISFWTFAQYNSHWIVQCESKKSPPLRGPDIFHFFYKRLRIFNRFFTTYYISHNMLKMSTIGRNACVDKFA